MCMSGRHYAQRNRGSINKQPCFLPSTHSLIRSHVLKSTPRSSRKNYKELSTSSEGEASGNSDFEILITPTRKLKRTMTKNEDDSNITNNAAITTNSVLSSELPFQTLDYDNTSSIYQQVISGVDPNAIIKEWNGLVAKAPQGAILEILNLLIEASGVQSTLASSPFITPNDMEKYQADPIAIINAIQSRIQSVQPRSLFSGRIREQKRERKIFKRFWIAWSENLAKSIQEEEIIQASLIWLLNMTNASFRPLRHASTCAALDSVLGLTNVLAASESTGNIPCKSVVEKQCQLLIDAVFVQRFRDVDPLVRMECLSSLQDWIHYHPETYLDNSYIRYLGWALSDKDHSVRDHSIHCTICIIKESVKRDSMDRLASFIDRFKKRIYEMAIKDVDLQVRKSAISLVHSLYSFSLLQSTTMRIGKETESSHCYQEELEELFTTMIKRHCPMTKEHLRLLVLLSGTNWESIIRFVIRQNYSLADMDYLVELLKDQLTDTKYLLELLSREYNSLMKLEKYAVIGLYSSSIKHVASLLLPSSSTTTNNNNNNNNLLIKRLIEEEEEMNENVEVEVEVDSRQAILQLITNSFTYNPNSNYIDCIIEHVMSIIRDNTDSTIVDTCIAALKSISKHFKNDTINMTMNDLHIVNELEDHLPTLMINLDWNKLGNVTIKELALLSKLSTIKSVKHILFDNFSPSSKSPNIGNDFVSHLTECIEFISTLFVINLPQEHYNILIKVHDLILTLIYQELLWEMIEIKEEKDELDDIITHIHKLRDFLYRFCCLHLSDDEDEYDRRRHGQQGKSRRYILLSTLLDLLVLFSDSNDNSNNKNNDTWERNGFTTLTRSDLTDIIISMDDISKNKNKKMAVTHSHDPTELDNDRDLINMTIKGIIFKILPYSLIIRFVNNDNWHYIWNSLKKYLSTIDLAEILLSLDNHRMLLNFIKSNAAELSPINFINSHVEYFVKNSNLAFSLISPPTTITIATTKDNNSKIIDNNDLLDPRIKQILAEGRKKSKKTPMISSEEMTKISIITQRDNERITNYDNDNNNDNNQMDIDMTSDNVRTNNHDNISINVNIMEDEDNLNMHQPDDHYNDEENKEVNNDNDMLPTSPIKRHVRRKILRV